MAARSRPCSRDEFEIAILCALQVEADAVDALLEVDWEEDESYGKVPGDTNAYRTGCIGVHNVVVVLLSEMGKKSASVSAAWLRVSFQNIRLGLVVGVCGGLPRNPSTGQDIVLGDIIISTGIVQYDHGRQYPNEIRRRDTLESNLSRPPTEIRAFLNHLGLKKSMRLMQDNTSAFIDEIFKQNGFEASRYPGRNKDKLYESNYRHKHQDVTTCNVCSMCQTDSDPVCDLALESSCTQLGCSDQKIARKLATDDGRLNDELFKPRVHFGRIASGDLVIKSGIHRDQIAKRDGVLGFETEGAGIWEAFPAVIIKSVCDYADSHKNKVWQEYAAVAAAACTKAFLKVWRITDKSLRLSNTAENASRNTTEKLLISNDKLIPDTGSLLSTASTPPETNMITQGLTNGLTQVHEAAGNVDVELVELIFSSIFYAYKLGANACCSL